MCSGSSKNAAILGSRRTSRVPQPRRQTPYGAELRTSNELLREVIEDVAIAGQVRERDREDDGTRMSVDDLAEELGIDLDE